MKKQKKSKEDKQLAKFRKDYKRLAHLIGEDAAQTMIIGIIQKGIKDGKINEDEYHKVQEMFISMRSDDNES